MSVITQGVEVHQFLDKRRDYDNRNTYANRDPADLAIHSHNDFAASTFTRCSFRTRCLGDEARYEIAGSRREEPCAHDQRRKMCRREAVHGAKPHG